MVTENKPKRMRTPWTIEDIRYLETHYGVKKTREIAAYLNRSATAVRAMAYLVGITTPVAVDWSETEIEIVRRDYPAGVALADICARLNGRAPKLGVKFTGNGRLRLWTAEEWNVLSGNIALGPSALMKLLPGRSRHSVQGAMRRLQKMMERN